MIVKDVEIIQSWQALLSRHVTCPRVIVKHVYFTLILPGGGFKTHGELYDTANIGISD